MAIDTFARQVSGQGYGGQLFPTLGLSLLLVLTLGSLPVRWEQVPVWTIGILPVLDVLAVGMVRLTDNGGGSSVVVVLPAIWLARQFGRRGAALAVASVALLQALPGVVYLGIDGVSLSRAVLLPMVAGAAAYGVAVGLESFQTRSAEAADRGHRLELATALVVQQQRVNRAVLDTVDVGLVLLGPDGRDQTINRRQLELREVAFPEGHDGIAGQRGDVFADDGSTALPPTAMPSARATRGEEFDDYRIWVGVDPATRRALSVSARTLRDEEGEFLGAALAYKDVTDLARALQVQDEFVATVSHELRTPLTSILGYVDLVLEHEGLDPVVAHQLGVVERNGQRLLRLVGDLLHTAQVTNGALALERSECDVVPMVHESLVAARPAAAAAGVRLEADLPACAVAAVDRVRVAQVVDNVLSNAVKYNREGGSVTIGLAVTGSDEDTLEIVVADTGPGMPPEDRDRLFTRFYRARHAVDHAIPGAGLGLSICKSIVEAHGGRIEVESAVEVGTRVRLSLPRAAGRGAVRRDARLTREAAGPVPGRD